MSWTTKAGLTQQGKDSVQLLYAWYQRRCWNMQGGVSSLSFTSVISDKLNLEGYIIPELIRDLKVHLDHEFATGAKKRLTFYA